MLHFASLTLFDEGVNKTKPVLVFESNIDRPLRRYVTELVRVGRKGLDEIYSCGNFLGRRPYPGRGKTDAAVVRYLTGLNRRVTLYHIGHPNRSVQEIRGDHELRRSIAHELETNTAALRDLSPADIVRAVRCKACCPSQRVPAAGPTVARRLE